MKEAVKSIDRMYRLGAGIGLLLAGSLAAHAGQTLPEPPRLHVNDEIIELDVLTPVIINPVTGDIHVTAIDPEACVSSPPPPSCDNVQVQITTFTVSPTQIEQGFAVSAAWSTRGAWECQRSGLPGSSWNTAGFGSQISGSLSLPTSNVAPGSHDVRLECRNGPVTAILTRPLAVLEPDPGNPECSSFPPPNNFVRNETALRANFNGAALTSPTTAWQHVWGNGDPFPVSSANLSTIGLSNLRYMSLGFNSGSLASGVKGRLHFSEQTFGGFYGGKAPFVVLSRCEGDFGPQPDARCRFFTGFGGTGSFRWQEASSLPSTSTRCPIEANTSYFFNVTFTNPPAPAGSNLTWSCPPGSGSTVCLFQTQADNL